MTDHTEPHNDGHDGTDIIGIEADGSGQPCFGCYFGAVYDSLRPEQLASIDLDPEDQDADPEWIEMERRLGGAFAYVADGIAAIAIEANAEHAEEIVNTFCERVRRSLLLVRAPTATTAH